MKLVSRKVNAAGAALRFKEQYYGEDNGSWCFGLPAARADTYQRLCDSDGSPDSVSGIVGESWVRIDCTECGSSVEAGVELGEELDYESATVHLCLPCLRAAVSMLEAELQGSA